ncbi:MAG: penicillin-binding transpeptidase domain-containing protein, partial [Defluviitaleaceae bacterium]|nr:penicillin-binding transpeptidase domain-containing protein [Defluviitaleaceae bacterium]
SAVIAAITQNPSRLSPINNPERNRARKLLVLDNMLRLEFITEEEHAYAAADTDVYARIVANERVTEQLNSVHSYFVDSLIQQVATDLSETFAVSRAEAFHWMHTGGLRIYATKDSEMQAIMDAAFMDDTLFPTAGFSIDVHYYASKRNTLTGRIEHVERRGNVARADEIEPLIEVMRSQILRDNEYIFAERIVPIPQPQAAMVVMDWRTGHVKAISGGRGEKMLNLGLNRAVDSRRQPGSVFKTIASFAPAIDLGRVHAGTLINDAPFTFEGYTPRNWYEGFWGPSSIRRGMAQSMNVLSVINMINTGIEDSFRYVLNFGFTTIVTPENPVVRGNQVFHDMVPSLPLGGLTWGVTQLELTAAFAAIANDGQFNYAKFYTRVVDREGRILLEAVPVQRQILRPQAAYILTDMMRDVVTHGTGTHTRLRNTNIPVSGKTGTTTNTHDLMFTGYTPFLAASIWMGYDQPERLRTNTHHMLLWREVMEGIHADFEFRDFVQPSGIIRGTFCGISGQRPVHGRCRQIVTDLFIVGDRTNENCLVCTQEDFRPLLMMLEEPEDDAAGDNYGEDISVGYPVNGDDITEYNGTEVDDETGQPQTIPNEPEDDITQPPTWLPPGGTGLPPDHPGDAVPPVSYPEDDSDTPPWLNLT